MKTPAGKECLHYYQDFHRGRAVQECRLAARNSLSANWEPGDCGRCAVPEILYANASPHMRLKLTIRSGFFGLGRRNEVEAYCERHELVIENPMVGCPKCNSDRPNIDAFLNALEGPE